MGESLLAFKDWFDDGCIPPPIVQRFTTQLLQAIEFAHSCGVVHTYIKQSNIMVQIPDESLLVSSLKQSDERLKAHEQDSTNDTTQIGNDEYEIISSQGLWDDYLEEGFNLMDLDIVLADWGVATWEDKHLSELIQPVLLRAPEVLLKAPWDKPVDIWNLGALVPGLMFGQCMFNGKAKGQYSAKSHFEEMNGLLGPFPAALLASAKLEAAKEWFDTEGNIPDIATQKVVPLKKRFADLEDEEAQKFEGFVRAMLQLDPKERQTARV